MLGIEGVLDCADHLLGVSDRDGGDDAVADADVVEVFE